MEVCVVMWKEILEKGEGPCGGDREIG